MPRLFQYQQLAEAFPPLTPATPSSGGGWESVAPDTARRVKVPEIWRANDYPRPPAGSPLPGIGGQVSIDFRNRMPLPKVTDDGLTVIILAPLVQPLPPVIDRWSFLPDRHFKKAPTDPGLYSGTLLIPPVPPNMGPTDFVFAPDRYCRKAQDRPEPHAWAPFSPTVLPNTAPVDFVLTPHRHFRKSPTDVGFRPGDFPQPPAPPAPITIVAWSPVAIDSFFKAPTSVGWFDLPLDLPPVPPPPVVRWWQPYFVPERPAVGLRQAGEVITYATPSAAETLYLQLDHSLLNAVRKGGQTVAAILSMQVFDDQGNTSTDLTVTGQVIGVSQTYGTADVAVDFVLTNVNAGLSGGSPIPTSYLLVCEVRLSGGNVILSGLDVQVEGPAGINMASSGG